ncbi:hypothetical protein DCO58_00985 [Helicobacter saguini]|uniref:Uncharacterized protein n=1 Tax=Helicobacter saguini TaxID=1548018 RepID=A0A347VR47_9HELI|nr:hypothetical protein [Helicobacter saguini]MWV63037.1 hypothetical protein [Helicobacter saguini]MWV66294.1 hypothetical protein [Helicobacter saguini]MWV68646.1 hypothetical protein [Helicobacter saguini]MWV71803.1 hypothetical protein [Helicobacter saguini]TLD95830.1 hypothetical protein LS64_000200 [Helicobacter saguini]
MKNLQNLRSLLTKHSEQIINALLHSNTHFSLQCKTSSVKFNPPLPHEIKQGFHPIIDFILAGFTFESIEIFDDELSFEAGFGKDNFATNVIIPFSSIIQIYLPSTNSILPQACVFMNSLNLLDLAKNDPNFLDVIDDDIDDILNDTENKEQSIDNDLMESSRKAILSNPDNKFK